MNKSRFFYGYWIVLAGFFTLTLSSGLAFYGYSVLNKPIADFFGWSRSEVTVAFLMFMAAIAGFSPVAGKLTDTHGPRRILMTGSLVMSISFVLLSLTRALWSYYLLHLLLGVAFALLGALPVSILVSSWFSRLRGTMQGLAFTGIGFGGLALAPLIGNYLVPNFGWRTVYLVMAMIALVVMLPLLLFVIRNDPHQKGLQPFGQEDTGIPGKGGAITVETGKSPRQALRTVTFWIIAITSAIYGMSMTGGLQNQVSILTTQGIDTGTAVTAIGFVGLVSAIGKFIFGYLCDHINPKYAAAIAYSLVGISLITMIQVRSTLFLWLYTLLMGFGQGGWAPNLSMLAGYYFGRKHYGTVLGIIHMVFFAGEAIGPMIVGFTFDHTGGYNPALTLFSLLCLASVPLIALIRKPKDLPGLSNQTC